MDYTGRIVTKNQVVPTANSAPGIWTLDEAMQYTKQGKWPPGYQISRSVRLRSSASAYFNRTLTTPTNNKIWTFSCWFKRGQLTYGASGASGALFYAPSSGSTFAGIYFTPGDLINWYDASGGATVYLLQTAQVFRDPSAWYHLVCAYDSTQATDTNRQKIYINGVQVTSFASGGSSYVAQNTNGRFNSAVAHDIGKTSAAGPYYFDGQMTEINFIDGQALTPASFGYTDTATGVWQPAPYNGTYGANGFYLNFKDPTSTTTIAYDYSGNSNNWTANNISVTAGTTYDSMVDVPINWGTDTGVGGEVRGNYPTFSPIDISTGSPAQTITQGNLSLFSSSLTRIDGAYSTMAVTSGRWYVELTCTTRTADYPTAGWCSTSFNTNGSGFQHQAGNPNNTKGASLDPGGAININGATTASNYYGTTWSTGNVIQVAVDIDNKLIWFGKAGSWTGTAGNMNGNPATGTNGASFSGQGGTEWKFQSCVGDNDRGDVNFGQRPFSYTAPTGFKALCTQNLPVPTILNGANYNASTLYTGNGGTLSVSNGANNTIGTTFQPDFVWTKPRVAASSHALFDSVRGASKILISNSTAAESNLSPYGVTAFNSNGFSLSDDAAGNYYVNGASGGTYSGTPPNYVGWQWKGGGTAVTNTSGTITSSVSANTSAGFSVVTYTGNGTSGATIGHGLGATASFIILKRRDGGSGYSWYVQHPALGPTKALFLDSTSGAATSANYWNNTAPTSTVFSVGNDTSLNANTGTYVSYCWTAISGYSAFGSYTGNGSGDGPFIYLGFRPRWWMHKNYGASGDGWWVYDSVRNTYNALNFLIQANLSNAEVTQTGTGIPMDFVANGVKIRNASGDGSINGSGSTYIYAAFAENPFTIARAR